MYMDGMAGTSAADAAEEAGTGRAAEVGVPPSEVECQLARSGAADGRGVPARQGEAIVPGTGRILRIGRKGSTPRVAAPTGPMDPGDGRVGAMWGGEGGARVVRVVGTTMTTTPIRG